MLTQLHSQSFGAANFIPMPIMIWSFNAADSWSHRGAAFCGTRKELLRQLGPRSSDCKDNNPATGLLQKGRAPDITINVHSAKLKIGVKNVYSPKTLDSKLREIISSPVSLNVFSFSLPSFITQTQNVLLNRQILLNSDLLLVNSKVLNLCAVLLSGQLGYFRSKLTTRDSLLETHWARRLKSWLGWPPRTNAERETR